MNVFDTEYAGQYDQLYTEKNYKAECDLIEAGLARYSRVRPLKILDVGCGTGAHAIELAGRNYVVTGVDPSQAMLSIAQAKARIESGSINWIHGDAAGFRSETIYDAALMMFAVVGYLTKNPDVIAGLKNIRNHIKKDAVLLCDFWYGPAVLSVKPTDRIREIANADGSRIIRSASTTVDSRSHTADVRFQVWKIRNKVVEAETIEVHRMRYFFPQEFVLFLELAGFKLENLTAFPSLDSPVGDNTWNAFAVARAV